MTTEPADPMSTAKTAGDMPAVPDDQGIGPEASVMKKKELIDKVVTRSGVRKKDAKPVVEAMLAVLGEAIGQERELNLQPFGKLRINRSVEKPNARITVCKLRQNVPGQEGKDPLAEAGE